MNTSESHSAYGRHTKPHLAQLLSALRLDYEVLKACGNKMHIRHSDGSEAEVIDFVGGYGANLLGHKHPAMEQALAKYCQGGGTAQAQLSFRNKSGELSSLLCQLAAEETGEDYITVLGNTGAEAVEIALRHARLKWYQELEAYLEKGRRTFQLAKNQVLQASCPEEFQNLLNKQEEWLTASEEEIRAAVPVAVAIAGAYHGKTAAALAVTDTPESRAAEKVIFLEPQKLIHPESFPVMKIQQPVWRNGKLDFEEVEISAVSVIIAEPLQGEGGVRALTIDQAQALRRLASQLHCPLIWDEIQSGCYRTGSFFYSSQLQVPGDYYCLGKALGGGEAKLSAVLIARSQYLPEYDLLHNSTFAEDDFSAVMGLAFLAQRHQVKKKVEALAPQFRKSLGRLQQHFPKLIKEFRGTGLIWGLEFYPMDFSGSYSLQALSRSGYFSYMLAAWLLNVCGIRCSAPLSQQFVLRFHADVACTETEIFQLEKALQRLCSILQGQDLYQLLGFSLPEPWQQLRSDTGDFWVEDVPREEASPGTRKVGFITHYIDTENIRKADISLALLPDEALEVLLQRFYKFLPPILNGSRVITDVQGRQLHLSMIGMAFTSKMAKTAMESRQPEAFRSKVQESVDMLENWGCEVIGLGQYSSIITRNGKSLLTKKAVLTTGNGLTVYLAGMALLRLARDQNIDLKEESLALVGGFGNIGSCLLEWLQKEVREVVVFTGANRTRANGQTMKMQHDLRFLKEHRLVMLATNSTDILVSAANTAVNAIISDISVPGNVDPDLMKNPGNRHISLGGIAQLPDQKGIPSKGFPLPNDLVFGCVSETLVLGISGRYDLLSLGELQVAKLHELGLIAAEAGFKIREQKPVARNCSQA